MTVTLERPTTPPQAPPPAAWDPGPGRRPDPGRPLALFVWLVVAAVGMFFLGLTVALLGRMGSAGWTPVPRPGVLWLGTAALLGSSALLEAGRRALRDGQTERAWQRLRRGAGLGAAFLGAQVGGWWWLSSSGVGVATSPGASYFYVLSGAHLAHVLGGLAWWGWLLWGGSRRADTARVSALSVYWHFLAALWVWLFAVLFTR